jgi:transcriptional antiterminator NusG
MARKTKDKAQPPAGEAESTIEQVVPQESSTEVVAPAAEAAVPEPAAAAAQAPVEELPVAEALVPEPAAEAKEAPEQARVRETVQEEAAEKEPSDGRAWYAVHSYSGYENKVKKNLEKRIESMNMQHKIFQVVVPTEEEIEIKEGHRRRTKKRIFPGYVLVQMIMDEESWYVVRNTPGVTGFVSSGSESKPTPLRPEEVEQILKRMEAEAPKIKVSFREGQTVRIIDGPFTDFVGTVEEMDLEKGKVRVLVSFFGRETPIELDFLQVQKQ